MICDFGEAIKCLPDDMPPKKLEQLFEEMVNNQTLKEEAI